MDSNPYVISSSRVLPQEDMDLTSQFLSMMDVPAGTDFSRHLDENNMSLFSPLPPLPFPVLAEEEETEDVKPYECTKLCASCESHLQTRAKDLATIHFFFQFLSKHLKERTPPKTATRRRRHFYPSPC